MDLKRLKNARFVGPTTSNYLEYICKKLCLERGGYEPQYTKAEPTIVKILSYIQYNDCWPCCLTQWLNTISSMRT